jgi:hypothetical protein
VKIASISDDFKRWRETLVTREDIKEMAKATGVKDKDLLALARQHDPFFKGTAVDHQKARWFTDKWEQFGSPG